MATKTKLQIQQGATFRRLWIWKVGKPPVPVDLTGCTARMQVRDNHRSEIVLLELTTENGGVSLVGVEGRIGLYVSALDTAAIPWESGVWDLEIVHPDGEVRRLFEGSITVSPEVTRG